MYDAAHNPEPVAEFSVGATETTESRRTIANRINARKSTGPRTEEGKERSRRNAVKHGLAGAGTCMPADLEEEAKGRAAKWAASLGPKDDVERDLVEMGASAMTRVRRCWREEEAARKRAIGRAERAWEADRRADAESKGGRLAKAPGRVSAELRKGLHGAEWMAERWGELAHRLDAGKDWTGPQRSLALDLLGVGPEFRDELTPIDFPGLAPREAAKELRGLVTREIARLVAEIDRDLADLDADDRALRIDDLAVLGDAEVRRLERYERTLSNRVFTVLATLRRGPAPADESKPTVEPATPPAAEPKPSATLSTETASALQVAPSLVPPPPEPEPATPDDYREWLRSRPDSDVETMLLPLLMVRLASMQEELAAQLGVDAPEC